MRHPRRPRLTLTLLALVVLLPACYGGAYYVLDVRREQVTAAVRRDLETHLPVGSGEDAARRYFAAKGWKAGYNSRYRVYGVRVTDAPGSLLVPTNILIHVYLDEDQRVQRIDVRRHIVMP